jgi:predicted flap endonuclease-1-like 5' DNA nuclease
MATIKTVITSTTHTTTTTTKSTPDTDSTPDTTTTGTHDTTTTSTRDTTGTGTPDTSTSTTKKHAHFIDGPILDKDVSALPGIGDVAAKKLGEAGFKKACKVVGQFLVLDKDKDAFKEWLMRTSGARADCREKCYKAIKEWTDNYV